VTSEVPEIDAASHLRSGYGVNSIGIDMDVRTIIGPRAMVADLVITAGKEAYAQYCDDPAISGNESFHLSLLQCDRSNRRHVSLCSTGRTHLGSIPFSPDVL